MRVRYSYLPQQFSKTDEIFAGLKKLVQSGDFTLGAAVAEFEQRFAKLIGTKFAVGVGSGTDALKLSLEATGVKRDDEVITAANTFIATVGAINEIGAQPVLIDCLDNFCFDPNKIEASITEKTTAIMPVHLTGEMPDMDLVMTIADKHNLIVVEDACQSILGAWNGKNAGTWGAAAGFSLHPLKNLNVWGDAGIAVTNDEKVADKLKLIRNHGLVNRDEIEVLGHNSRLDSLQAVVGNWLIDSAPNITDQRQENALRYDQAFSGIKGLKLPPRSNKSNHVFHLYMVFAEKRDELYKFCHDKGVEAKIHYPIPLYQQNGLKHLGYSNGSFPITDRHAKNIISFPADQHLDQQQLNYVIETVQEFYKKQ